MSLTPGDQPAAEGQQLPTQEAAAPPMSLGDRIGLQQQYRAMLTDPNFDPARDIGVLSRIEAGVEANVEAIMQKVDNTVGWIVGLDAYAAQCRAAAKKLYAQARAAKNNSLRSKAYVDFQLSRDNATEFVGHTHVLKRVKKGGKPKVVVSREATAQDFVVLGDLVVEHPPVAARYDWHLDKIREQLKELPADQQVSWRDAGFSLDYGTKITHSLVGKPKTRTRAPRKKKEASTNG